VVEGGARRGRQAAVMGWGRLCDGRGAASGEAGEAMQALRHAGRGGTLQQGWGGAGSGGSAAPVPGGSMCRGRLGSA
jgi:hypothetical protein